MVNYACAGFCASLNVADAILRSVLFAFCFFMNIIINAMPRYVRSSKPIGANKMDFMFVCFFVLNCRECLIRYLRRQPDR